MSEKQSPSRVCRVRLKGAPDKTCGSVIGELDGMLRVRWDDGLCGMYWRLQLELCNG